MKPLALLSVCAGVVLAGLGSANGQTLFEALAATYANNPDLRAARASLRTTDEGVSQALSGWRPTVAVTGTAGYRRSYVNGASSGSTSTTTSSSSSTNHLLPNTQELEVTQPLYRGGRTVAETAQAESFVQASRASLVAREQDVLLEAVTAYMDVLRDGARVQLTANNEQVLRRQLEATQDRFQVGEVTRTDVAQAEARLSSSISSRVAAEGDLGSSRATYEAVVGQAPSNLTPAPPLPDLPGGLDEALTSALSSNPNVRNAEHNEQAAKHAVRAASGDLLPSVNLVGELSRSDESSTEGVTADSESIIARVSVPLYQAGAVHSQVREAKERRNERRIDIENVRRRIIESATQAWEELTSTRSEIVSRTEEVRATKIALEGVRQEAAVGSRTTLDVLDAEQELLDAQVGLVNAERDEYVAGYGLLAAIGLLTAERLGLPIEVYDVTRHYNQVRDKWWGWQTPQ